MEDGLVPIEAWMQGIAKHVLILVVMEDGLVLDVELSYSESKRCLNPCCDGRWSRTTAQHIEGFDPAKS